MNPGPLHRLRSLTFDEARWRVVEMAHRLGDRVRFRCAPPQWEQPRDTTVASTVLERLSRGQSRCVIDPSLARAIRADISRRWPTAVPDATARAERILKGEYDLLGYRGLRFSNWHSDPVHHREAPRICWADVPYLDPAMGDHKIIWELNRHQHWLQLGRALWLTNDERYAREIVSQFERWLDDNPPLTGINWASMLEIGFRAISWTMALHLLQTASCQLPAARFLVALDRQLRHVEQHLSYYFSPNTHLTGEALALYVAGSAFPELAASARWVATGRRILLKEIDRQILPDGGHVERSTHYQRYTLDFYLLALITARRVGDVDAARSFAAATTRLAEFTRVMADDDGRLPLIGDDDGGMLWPIAGRDCNDVRDSLAVAAVTLDRPDLAPWGLSEEVFWIAAPDAMRFIAVADVGRSAVPVPRSTTLPDTGYVVLRDDGGSHAVIDAGAHGYMNGGHAHADALSMTLRVGKRPLLVDPGTSAYTIDPMLRNRMRRSFNHNTIALDGRPQSTPAGPFHWLSTTTGTLADAHHNPSFDWVEATHDGYAPHVHRRSVIRAEAAGWLIVDELVGESPDVHSAAALWHFDPGWMVHTDGAKRLHARHFEGDEAWLLFDSGTPDLFLGNEESGLGWFAPVYGTLVPTWTARITKYGDLPFSIITWIGDEVTAGGTKPSLERIAVNTDASGDAVGVRLSCGDFTSIYLVRAGEPAARDSRACGIADYQTNARVMHMRTHGLSLVSLDLIDVSHALALRDGWLSVAASEPVRDLHARVDRGMLHLTTSEPPQELRVDASGTALLIRADDWTRSPSWPLFHFGAPFALDEVRPGGCEEFLPLRES